MTESAALSQSEFFDRLSKLFKAGGSESNKPSGSIFLTQKRLSRNSESSTSPSTNGQTPTSSLADFPDLHPASTLPVLIRATDGKGKKVRKDKTKLSTVVQPDELDAFFERYAEVCKTGMVWLKKRDRKARGKKKKGKKGGGDKK